MTSRGIQNIGYVECKKKHWHWVLAYVDADGRVTEEYCHIPIKNSRIPREDRVRSILKSGKIGDLFYNIKPSTNGKGFKYEVFDEYRRVVLSTYDRKLPATRKLALHEIKVRIKYREQILLAYSTNKRV